MTSIIEKALPLAHGGFINEITWNQFDLNVLFTYSIGRHTINIYKYMNADPGFSDENPLLGDVRKYDSWTGADNKNHDFPRNQLYMALKYQFTGEYDECIENVHFIRLKQLTLGYNLHERFAKKIGLSGARLFLTMENLFLLTNYSGLIPRLSILPMVLMLYGLTRYRENLVSG
ncbi:MAG: hypothetical protein V8R91_00430 [Butyricimonas faecihominis]